MKNRKLELSIGFNPRIEMIFILLICLIFLSCNESPQLEFDEKTFYREWAAWNAQGLADYSIVTKYELYWPRTGYSIYRIMVKDNEFVKPAEFIESDGYVNFFLLSILDAYNWIENLYEQHKNQRGFIRIVYNTDFHYPEFIDINLPPARYSPIVLGRGAVYLSEFTLLAPETEE